MVGFAYNLHAEIRKVSIIVVSYAGSVHVRKCLESLPTLAEKTLIALPGLSLAKKRNIGAMNSDKGYLLFVDDDNVLAPGSINRLVRAMDDNCNVAVAGMLGVYQNDLHTVCDSGSFRNMLTGFCRDKYVGKPFKDVPYKPYEVDEVANVFMVRREMFPGFDEVNFPIDLDEADLCRRLKKKNKKIIMVPMAITAHASQAYSKFPNFRRPINAYYMGRNRVLFQRKHTGSPSFLAYLVLFLPVFITSYIACLLMRKKFSLIPHFLKGVFDGVCNRVRSPERLPYNWK